MQNFCNLTQEQIDELNELENFPIDYSDIPRRTDFSNAHLKNIEMVTLGLDKDVYEALQTYGESYQTSINEILREVMLENRIPEFVLTRK